MSKPNKTARIRAKQSPEYSDCLLRSRDQCLQKEKKKVFKKKKFFSEIDFKKGWFCQIDPPHATRNTRNIYHIAKF